MRGNIKVMQAKDSPVIKFEIELTMDSGDEATGVFNRLLSSIKDIPGVTDVSSKKTVNRRAKK